MRERNVWNKDSGRVKNAADEVEQRARGASGFNEFLKMAVRRPASAAAVSPWASSADRSEKRNRKADNNDCCSRARCSGGLPRVLR